MSNDMLTTVRVVKLIEQLDELGIKYTKHWLGGPNGEDAYVSIARTDGTGLDLRTIGHLTAYVRGWEDRGKKKLEDNMLLSEERERVDKLRSECGILRTALKKIYHYLACSGDDSAPDVVAHCSHLVNEALSNGGNDD